MPHATPACIFGDCWRCPGYVEGGGLCEHDCHGHTRHPSFVLEACDPVEPPELSDNVFRFTGEMTHEIIGFASHEDLEVWLDEPKHGPVPTMLGAAMLCALVIVVVALLVPFAAWLSHVGGWTRAAVGVTIAMVALRLAVKR